MGRFGKLIGWPVALGLTLAPIVAAEASTPPVRVRPHVPPPADSVAAAVKDHFAGAHEMQVYASATGSAADRRQAIDAAWGAGLPTDEKLRIFDTFWLNVDSHFAAWQGIEHVDWAALRTRYRAEIAEGVSRGRFAAIMNHLALALRESHTVAEDRGVNWASTPQPGVPLLWARPWLSNRVGVCATALEDGSALIYEAVPDHPLGIVRGDRILGFDGRPWSELYHELLDEELPIATWWWGSSPSAFTHTFVASAPLNWHLFETIDVAKQATGTVEHVQTALLRDRVLPTPTCSDQMDVGIAKPEMIETNFSNVVSWGFLPGTRIGYVYVWGWFGDAGTGFANAIEELTQRAPSDGLIIDFRFNLGGNMFLSDKGLGMLFGRPTPTIDFAQRLTGHRHDLMRPAGTAAFYAIDAPGFGYDPRSYDGPVAVLTGPGALSSGDQVALRMTYHPRARLFGKSTAAAFNAPNAVNLHDDWYSRIATADAYRLESPLDYLTHDELVVDEAVWLTPADAAAGRDTVVESALRWITGQG